MTEASGLALKSPFLAGLARNLHFGAGGGSKFPIHSSSLLCWFSQQVSLILSQQRSPRMTKHVSQFLAAAASVALIATQAVAQSVTSDSKPRPGSPVTGWRGNFSSPE